MRDDEWKRLEGHSFQGSDHAYRLETLLGVGGFGAVFRAVPGVGRAEPVAVKLIDPAGQDAAALMRELVRGLRLRHECLVDCHDAGLAALDGRQYHYLAMELAQGTLQDRIRRSTLRPAEAGELVGNVAAALGYLHTRPAPLVHRDLKPGNILRVNGRWKLSDYGISRAVAEGTSNLTRTLIGSLSHMPPESFEGVVSPAWDVWALGVVLVEALTGQPPFGGATDVALMRSICDGEPWGVDRLPEPIRQIARGCLVKGREQRWTVERVLQALQEEVPTRRVEPATWTDAGGLEYVLVPAGTFWMGCSEGDGECYGDERPRHEVTISRPFWMARTPVTVGAYRRFARATGRAMPAEPNLLGHALNAGWKDEQQPIVNIDWEDAQAYCQWAGGRLPREAEWEWAARGGTAGARYGELEEIAWTADNSGKSRMDSRTLWENDQANYWKKLAENGNGPKGVGQKAANGYGLHDMLGNVYEWVGDWYGPYSAGSVVDPTGPASGESRVLRGGSWSGNPRYARASLRHGLGPAVRFYTLGGRCVREQQLP